MGSLFEKSGGIILGSGPASSRYIKFDGPLVALIGYAPVTGIQIKQQVDFSMLKTIGGNFSVLTFEDHPVLIRISGLSVIGNHLCSGGQSNWSTLNLYNYSKVSKYRTPIKVTIGNATFKCIVVACTHSASSKEKDILSYDMTLMGVRI